MDSFFEGSFNSYAPLVDTSILDSVSWVAPRLYNDALPQRSNVSKYVSSLREGRELEWDGRQIKVDIPPDQLEPAPENPNPHPHPHPHPHPRPHPNPHPNPNPNPTAYTLTRTRTRTPTSPPTPTPPQVDIPPSKLVLGHPASADAVPARQLEGWQKEPDALVDHYRASPELLATVREPEP